MKINLDQFSELYSAIEEKLLIINDLPRVYGTGTKNINVLIDIEAREFTVTSETWCSGCDDVHYYCTVLFDEINEPIDYFIDKFQKEINKHEEAEQIRKEIENNQIEERERREYKRLQEKYNGKEKE